MPAKVKEEVGETNGIVLPDPDGKFEVPEPQRPKRSIREGRSDHLEPQNIGRMTLYTFKDVLDYAYSVGFVRFGRPHVEVVNTLDANGKPQSTAIVSVPAIFMQEGFDAWSGTTVYHEVECWGIGDANFENTGNKNIGQHFIRMAETRAKGRALAHALNLDANFAEEMTGDDDSKPSSTPSRSNPKPSGKAPSAITEADYPPPNDGADGWICEETGAPVTGKNAYWSMRKYGQILSWDEQQKRG